MTILVTGGAGFIGSNFILDWLEVSNDPIVNLDVLSYAGNLSNLAALNSDQRYTFLHGDITDSPLVEDVLRKYRPRAILHLAAESHVDRSILRPRNFIQTNILGTYVLLDAAQNYWRSLTSDERAEFRLLHVGTDEVYGALGPHDPPFTEADAFLPNSPYSASKAASNHLVRAWTRTYDLPAVTINSCNVYGPYQFPEKLIPLIIVNSLAGQPLPVYGDGLQVRDWLYVRDLCSSIRQVLQFGRTGDVFNVGGRGERTNIDVIRATCALLDEMHPSPDGSYSRLITYVSDRPGHDRRYAINPSKLERELGWRARETFDSGLRKTVQWYLDHADWRSEVQSRKYDDWIALNYGCRTVL